MFKFDKDDFFNYLVATDQLDDFLGKKNKEDLEEQEEYDDDDDNDSQDDKDEQG